MNKRQRCSLTMTPVLLLLLGAFVSAQRGTPAVVMYPGLLKEGFVSNERNPNIQIPEDITTENYGLLDETTEYIVQSTPLPEEIVTDESEQKVLIGESNISENTTPDSEMSDVKLSTQIPNVDVTTLPQEQDMNNEISNTYYQVDHKEPKYLTNVIQEKQDSHPCVRECLLGALPMRCYYEFEVEWYHSMSKACYNCSSNKTDCERKHCIALDGIQRPIISVNRQFPGPSVEVCLGDTIVVDITNHMMEESTTIHWHGQHQRDTPYMDGVPYVTQCPIPPKSKFRYTFKAETSGTHFWHSHSGCQRADGAFGALIIHTPRSMDPHSNLYDFDLTDHTIQILDWEHKLGIEKFLAHHHSNGTNKPVTLLVNGKGWVGGLREVPAERFIVDQGYRYRFRLINAGFLNCPIELSVDNHTIWVISSDGRDFKPVQATSLVSYAGERFDFILEANQNVSNYWMRFRGLMDCDERFTSSHQIAVLHYLGAPVHEEPQGIVDYESSHRDGLQVNTLNVGPGTYLSTVIPELDSVEEDDDSLKSKPDMQFYVSYDFYGKDNPHYHRAPYYGFKDVPDVHRKLYTPQLNHISMKLPSFPLLSGRNLIKSDMFCNESTVSNCEDTYCECTHVIQVPLGNVVELILVDKGFIYDANHPFHLHGHTFRVVAMGRVGNFTTVDEVKSLDERGLIKRKLKGAPIKDTVTVPDGGYTVVRFHANNPGYWLFHCHIEFHVELGMSIVFKVGEHSDMVPVPRGFPQCNDYLPEDDDDIFATVLSDMDNEVPFQRYTHTEPSSGSRTVASLLLFVILLISNL